MKMKKLSIATVVMLSLGVSAAQASDGTINFSGSVSAAACSIDAESSSLTVSYDAIPVASLSALGAGMTAPALQKPFSIKLTNCPESISSARIMIEGLTSSYNPSVFITPGGDSSTNARYMGAIIQNASTGGTINAQTFNGENNVTTIAAGNNTLNYIVGLTRTFATRTPTAGNINIPLTYTMSYQ